MTLSNYQYTYNGLTFGAGTDIQLVKEEGLRSLPDARTQDSNFPRQDGAWAGLNFLGERHFVITLAVTVTKDNPFETVIQDIVNAFQPVSDPTNQQWLTFKYPGYTNEFMIKARVIRAGFPVDLDYSFHRVVSLPIEFVANDPTIYNTVPTSTPLTLDFSTPFINNGNYQTYPVISITGPVTNPKIEINENNFISFSTTVPSGYHLDVDLKAGTANLINTSTGDSVSVLNTIAIKSNWLSLPNGTTVLSYVSTDSPITDSVATVTLYDAWSWV
jgi:hypothetical protein